jgi:hypothetical protein
MDAAYYRLNRDAQDYGIIMIKRPVSFIHRGNPFIPRIQVQTNKESHSLNHNYPMFGHRTFTHRNQRSAQKVELLKPDFDSKA